MNTNMLISIVAFTVLSILWLSFAYALLFNRPLLDKIWLSFRSWPFVIQLILTLLVLPVALGLFVWRTKWPIWLRLILIVGLAWFTEYTFFPAAATSF